MFPRLDSIIMRLINQAPPQWRRRTITLSTRGEFCFCCWLPDALGMVVLGLLTVVIVCRYAEAFELIRIDALPEEIYVVAAVPTFAAPVHVGDINDKCPLAVAHNNCNSTAKVDWL